MKTIGLLSFLLPFHHVQGFVQTNGYAKKLHKTKLSSSPAGQQQDTPTSTTVQPDLKAYSNGYQTVREETSCKNLTPSSGAIPPSLRGTYYRVGPAMFTSGSFIDRSPSSEDGKDADRGVKHPFEGDGAVLALTFHGDGTVTARYKYVRTVGFLKENRKGAKIYKGMESTRASGVGSDFPLPGFRYHLQPGLNKMRTNRSNTRTVYWNKKLFTTWEGGLPYKLDSLALSTEGKSQFGGVFEKDTAMGSKSVICPSTKSIFFYSVDQQESFGTLMTVYEFDSKFQLKEKRQEKLPGFALVSDFAVSDRYVLVVQPAVKVNGMQWMLSKDPAKTLTLDEDGDALLHLIPRNPSQKMITIPIPNQMDKRKLSHFNIELCNAYEEDSSIIMDVILSSSPKNTQTNTQWPWSTTLSDYSKSTSKKSLWRYTINPQTQSVERECLTNDQVSFGSVHPSASTSKHKFLYMNVGGLGEEVSPPQGILKYDCERKQVTETWIPESYEFCGEPMVVSSTEEGEGDGLILSILNNGQSKTSELIIFPLDNLSKGPVARVPLEGMYIPHGLFGCFGKDADWPLDEIERRAKLADKMAKRGSDWNEMKSDFSGLGLRADVIEDILGDIF